MTEKRDEKKMPEHWKEIEARLGLTDDAKIVTWVTCSKCGEEHAVDDLQERTGVSLYCDTHGVRVPFPNAFLHRLKDEHKAFGVSLKQERGEKDGVSFGTNKDKSAAEWRFRF